MRKDSEIFLRKCLQYKTEIGEDAFELNITYFGGIPNIEVEIDEIINELKTLRSAFLDAIDIAAKEKSDSLIDDVEA